jgi:hypothetical protein
MTLIYCNLHYKGNLKQDTDINLLFTEIAELVKGINCTTDVTGENMVIDFITRKGLTLIFNFNKRKIDGVFSWKGINEDELNKVFDLFIAIKPYFKSLSVHDTYDLFNHYKLIKIGCKISVKKLESKSELEFCNRAKRYKYKNLNDDEKNLLCIFGEKIYSDRLFVLMLQDLIKICGLPEFEKRVKAMTLKIMEQIPTFMKFMYAPFHIERIYSMVFLWINYTMSYKGKGLVYKLTGNEKGLAGSLEAAVFALPANLFGVSTLAVNPKHVLIDNFFNQQYKFEERWDLSSSNDGLKETTVLLSVLDYLGFEYVGAEGDK